ncbi:MAG: hypothetical protein JSR46_01130 [Verrucomicrobia bacterium]|nr:hypothetical protein [Verrucomicrobiota bacterium]
MFKDTRPLTERIATFEESDPRWEVEISPQKIKELNQILAQGFHFLGQGRQCTTYESRDGSYVIKFLWQAPLGGGKHGYSQFTDFSFLVDRFKNDQETYDRRKATLYSSFCVAYRYAPEQTGVQFMHLNSTKDLFANTLVLDSREDPALINSDSTQWVIQKRARLVKPVIIELMWKKKTRQAKQRIDQLFALLFECAKLGVIDGDSDLIFNDNIGFLENRAVYVDIGQLRRATTPIDRELFKSDIARLDPLYEWLQKAYPELAAYYKTRKTEVINSY